MTGKTYRRWLVGGLAGALLVVSALALVNCAGGDGASPGGGATPGVTVPPSPSLAPSPAAPTPTSGPPPATPPAVVVTPTATPAAADAGGGPAAPVPQHLLAAARRDLGGRTGVPENAITLVQAEPVNWPDTSLGYPQPDRFYAQVITPGWRLVLKAGNSLYEYHTDSQRVVFVGEKR